jgi:RND family efflux transporter MFP subunit
MRLGVNNTVWATALAVAVAGSARLLGRRPAVVHILWLLVMIKLVSPSLVRVGFPAIMGQRHDSLTRIELLKASNLERASQAPAVPLANSTQPAGTPDALSSSRDRPTAKNALTWPVWNTIRSWPWRPVVLAIWLTGAGAWWVVVGLCASRFRSLTRSARAAPIELENRTKHLAALLRLRRVPTIGIVPARVPPMLWAPFTGAPYLLLPEELWARFDTHQQDTVLVHELAHLKRRDHWVRRLEAVVMGLYWWDPIAWWARSELERTEEECCDAWVVRALPATVGAYADALVCTAVFLSGPRQPLLVGASGAGRTLPLKRRLNMILRDAPPRPQARTAPRAVLVLGVLGLPFLPALYPDEPAGAPSELAPARPQERVEHTAPPAKLDPKAAAAGGAYKEIALDPTKPAEKVRICQPIVRDVRDYIEAVGELEAAHTVQLRARVSGTIVSVNCRLGQIVNANVPLFQIDPRPYQAERDKAEAEVRRAEARWKRWTSQLARVKKQVERKVISAEEVELAEGEFGEAEASLRAAMADRDLARLKLDSTEVRAPIAGTISGSVLDAGSVVTADTTALAVIIALDPMYVVFSLDQSTVLRLKSKGTKKDGLAPEPMITVGLSGEEAFERTAVANFADLQVNQNGGVRCRAAMANGDGLMFPGLSARVRVVTGAPHKALLIPEKAVETWGDGPRVYVVKEMNIRESRPVRIGLDYDGLLTVTAGLSANEWVVAEAPARQPVTQ